MAAGDVTEVGPYAFPLSSAAMAAIKALRNSANDNWLAVPTANGQQVFFINIEEA